MPALSPLSRISPKNHVAGYRDAIVLSLDASDGKGIPRGGWVILDTMNPSVALFTSVV